VMSRQLERLYQILERSWEHLVKIKIEQKSFETNPQFIQIVPPGETVVVISFQVKLFQSTGLLTICYPYVSLEPIVSKLSAQNWIDANKKKNLDQDREINAFNLKGVESEVSTVLLETSLRMSDFLNLKVGDVIPSDKKINWPIDIRVNGRKKYIAKPGLSGKKRAFQVLDIFDEFGKENENDG